MTRQFKNDKRETLRFRHEASIEWQGLAGLKTDKMLKLKSDEETFINPQVGPWVQRGFWNIHNLVSLIMVYAFRLLNLPDDGRWHWERTRFLDVDWKCMPSDGIVSPQILSNNTSYVNILQEFPGVCCPGSKQWSSLILSLCIGFVVLCQLMSDKT